MFPVDSLPPQYCEERAAAEKARRLAEQNRVVAAQAQVKAPVAIQQAAPPQIAQTLQPPLTRPGSSTVLGSIFQNFAKKAASRTSSPAPSVAPSRAHTPAAQSHPAKELSKVEMDAEMKRDTDICAGASWY